MTSVIYHVSDMGLGELSQSPVLHIRIVHVFAVMAKRYQGQLSIVVGEQLLQQKLE